MNYIFQKKEFTNKIINLYNKQIYIGLKDLWIDNYNHNNFREFEIRTHKMINGFRIRFATQCLVTYNNKYLSL